MDTLGLATGSNSDTFHIPKIDRRGNVAQRGYYYAMAWLEFLTNAPVAKDGWVSGATDPGPWQRLLHTTHRTVTGFDFARATEHYLRVDWNTGVHGKGKRTNPINKSGKVDYGPKQDE
jgi:hypothetical protein